MASRPWARQLFTWLVIDFLMLVSGIGQMLHKKSLIFS
jgi:hypothetical protein